MAKLDIRNAAPDEVAEVVFADKSGDTNYMLYKLAKSSDADLFRAEFENDYAYVRYDDIDNLILALQKAKELWAN
jgi:hypothetical protein